MSLENGNELPESEYSSCLKTELTLGLPGGDAAEAPPKCGGKRGFAETVELKLGTSSDDGDEVSVSTPPPSNYNVSNGIIYCRAQVVGWPPVRSYRKKMMRNCKYVKVAVDGTPYLRKVDLEIYNSYQQLMDALEEMFTCLAICNVVNERKIMDNANGTEYVPTYEDRDGDWMLIGDVPWEMFVESCKRLRLMKSSEAIGLGIRSINNNLIWIFDHWFFLTNECSVVLKRK
ncbi:auxin-responsive protein iaa14 [Phtheirospermum japonicum]|uniref:Auxin-responsive protein n=1 Tax=Phtheirospermum japonicum TaxID=374723 RepID=A0A830DJ67_9LAMI|nr:auxin-responsive protein iaa14 [Phtheirospermum japonicum]